MGKKEVTDFGNDLGPMPTLNEFKGKLEIMLQKSRADFTVDWFLGLIEPHQKEEAPHVITSGGKRVWSWSYRTRVVSLLRKFLKIKPDFRETIIAARADNIYWRGDGKKFFYMVINETEKMRSIGHEKYQQEVKGEMRKFTGKRDLLQDMADGKI